MAVTLYSDDNVTFEKDNNSLYLKVCRDDLWLKIILIILGIDSVSKHKVFAYLLSVKNGEDYIISRYDDICSNANISYPIVAEAMKELINKQIITKVSNGVYKLNINLQDVKVQKKGEHNGENKKENHGLND